MANRKMEEKGHANTGGLPEEHEKKKVICPVCRKLLHKNNLVDVKSVVEDNLYYVGGVRIVECKIRLHCDFKHQFDEEGFTMDEPHKLVAVVNAKFDGSGKCVHFEIVEVLPGKKVK